MTAEPLDDLSSRLERERRAADDAYNAALTALDRALRPPPPAVIGPQPPDRSRLADLNTSWQIVGPGTVGGLPRGSSLLDRLRALVERIVRIPFERQQAFNAALVDHLNRDAAAQVQWIESVRRAQDAVQDAFGALATFQSLLLQYLQTITAYVDTKDRALFGADLRDRLSTVEQRVAALKLRVAELGSGAILASPTPLQPASGVFADDVDSLTYVGFEDKFRGAPEEIRGRVRDYVDLFAGTRDVVDLGCGRGELLALLAAHGISARGVDTNRGMVELCRSQGLHVDQGDALGFLQRQEDGSIGGLVAIQVVEHFEPAYLVRVLETAYLKMRPDAPLVLETLNPACWMAFFETYMRDLTHQQPLHPDTLAFLVRAVGFSSVDVRFRAPVTAEDRLDRVAWTPPESDAGTRAIVAAVNAHADKLNARLFSSMDYAVVARR